MGSDSSKVDKRALEYGGIYVNLDKQVYSPNDTVTGTINLNLIKPYPGSRLTLHLTGTEHARWVERYTTYSGGHRTGGRRRRKGRGRAGGMRHHRRAHHHTRVRKETLSTINQEVPIYTWGNNPGASIPAGQYSFPIAFRIPQGLPGSFFFQKDSIIAGISYVITGQLMPSDIKIPMLKHGREFVIREPLYQPVEQKQILLQKEIKTCCCCNKGTLNVRTHFEKNAYTPSEEAKIYVEIDNSTLGKSIDSLKFELIQHIRLQATGNVKTYDYPIASINLGSIKPNAKLTKEAKIQLPQGQEGRISDFYGEAEDQVQNFDPKKQMIAPSVNGYLVKSNYSLKLDCNITCICCDTIPSTEIPIQVLSAALYQEPQPMIPQGWQPQQMPVTNVSVYMLQLPPGYQQMQFNPNGLPNYDMMNYNQMQPNYNQMQQPNYNQIQPNYNQSQNSQNPMMVNQTQNMMNGYSNYEMSNYSQPAPGQY